jgi:membrane protein required for beta-lactamase induction
MQRRKKIQKSLKQTLSDTAAIFKTTATLLRLLRVILFNLVVLILFLPEVWRYVSNLLQHPL